jgi:predicted HTH domain antitoxin
LARALSLHLFEAGHVTLARGAKHADVSIEEFIELLGESGIDAVDYAPSELETEVEAAG